MGQEVYSSLDLLASEEKELDYEEIYDFEPYIVVSGDKFVPG